MSMTRQFGPILALGVAIALAACAAPAAPKAPAEPPLAVAPTPSPTATVEPAPDRLPPLEDLVITPAGIGSLLIGQPVSQTDMVAWEPEFCAELFELGIANEPGMWVPNYPNVGERGHLFDVSVKEGILRAIGIAEPNLRTAEGIGVGSSVDELTATYPALQEREENHLSKTLVHTTDEGAIVFEVMVADLGDRFRPGNLIGMRIFAPGQELTTLTAGTDNVYRSC